MANENYRILDERDLNNFEAGDNLSLKKEENKIIYTHTGSTPEYTTNEVEQPGTLEWGKEYSIQIPHTYDNKGHVDSMRNWTFTMPLKPENGVSELPIFGENKNYGWSATELGKPSDTNNEGETYNAQLDWGDTIRVPNFYVDEKGRVEKGWTAGYKLPQAPTNEDFSINTTYRTEESSEDWPASYTSKMILSEQDYLLQVCWSGGHTTEGAGSNDTTYTPGGSFILPVKQLLENKIIHAKFGCMNYVHQEDATLSITTVYFNLYWKITDSGQLYMWSDKAIAYLGYISLQIIL